MANHAHMGTGADDIIDLFERHASSYDQRRGRSLVERAWLDRFLAAMPSHSPVLDLGCGGGEPLSGYLIGKGLAVTGVDSSPTLIGLCKERYPGQEWIVADMRHLHLEHRFGGLLAWDSLFHLAPDDQRRFFIKLANHALPGAALLFSSGPEAGETMGELDGEPLYHASLGPAEYRSALNACGFKVLDYEFEDEACGNHTIWLAQFYGAPEMTDM